MFHFVKEFDMFCEIKQKRKTFSFTLQLIYSLTLLAPSSSRLSTISNFLVGHLIYEKQLMVRKLKLYELWRFVLDDTKWIFKMNLISLFPFSSLLSVCYCWMDRKMRQKKWEIFRLNSLIIILDCYRLISSTTNYCSHFTISSRFGSRKEDGNWMLKILRKETRPRLTNWHNWRIEWRKGRETLSSSLGKGQLWTLNIKYCYMWLSSLIWGCNP